MIKGEQLDYIHYYCTYYSSIRTPRLRKLFEMFHTMDIIVIP